MSAAELARALTSAVEAVIVGKPRQIEQLVVALLAGGHVLLEDVPGTGKTMLARSLASALGLGFHRIQCTPDLLPNDVTGVNVYDPRTSEFRFRAGPVFAHLVLADEVNRATPRTQAALLEAMQERQVTVDGETRALPRPFMVMATQNPVEFEGTFPLPEAQLDRFLLTVTLGYPEPADEADLVSSIRSHHPVEDVTVKIGSEQLDRALGEVDRIHLEADVASYIVSISERTRRDSRVALGASPRASIALGAAARALAAVRGRDYVLPDDVKELAAPVLAHRLVITADARLRGVAASDIVDEAVSAEPVDVAGTA